MMMSINMVMNPFTDILPITEMYHFHLFQFVCFCLFIFTNSNNFDSDCFAKFNALKSVA